MKVYLRRAKGLALKTRLFLLAVMLALASILGNVYISNPVDAVMGSVTEYPIPTANMAPANLTLGPDGNIWYTSYASSRPRVGKLTPVGMFTEYVGTGSGAYQRGITKGSDGNLWYGERAGGISGTYGRIVKMDTNGNVLNLYTPYNLPNGHFSQDMTLGPDGNVWFIEGGQNIVGKITTSGVITEYPISAPGAILGIAVGSDSNLWFTAHGTTYDAIGKITTSGVYTLYPLSTAGAYPRAITAGPDGNLWFSETGVSKIGKITTSGVITEYPVTSPGGPVGITAGSDGALWFVDTGVGRITTSGTVTHYNSPTGNSQLLKQIITGPDDAVWYTNIYGNLIGRVSTAKANQSISFNSSLPTGAVVDGPTYSPAATATSGLLVTITIDPSSSGVCSIDGAGKVSYQSAGTCTLNANQAGDADYNPAPQVQQSFTVLPVNADTSVALNCPSTANVNDTVTCTITIANNGPAAAENASLTALFPSSLTGASVSGGGTLTGQHITWSTPSLASGDSVVLTFSATASVAGKARFSAALLQTSPDPNNSNNLVDATIGIS